MDEVRFSQRDITPGKVAGLISELGRAIELKKSEALSMDDEEFQLLKSQLNEALQTNHKLKSKQEEDEALLKELEGKIEGMEQDDSKTGVIAIIESSLSSLEKEFQTLSKDSNQSSKALTDLSNRIEKVKIILENKKRP